jgi:hypothetical protein
MQLNHPELHHHCMKLTLVNQSSILGGGEHMIFPEMGGKEATVRSIAVSPPCLSLKVM